MKLCMLLLLVFFYACLLLPQHVVQAFRSQPSLIVKSFQHLSKVNPLQTAGECVGISSIPRLEPGLRVPKSLSNFFAREDVVPFASFSLQQLMKHDKIMIVDNNKVADHTKIPLNTLFVQAKQSLQKYTDVFVKYFRKLLAASMIIASSVTPSTIKRASLVTGTVMATLAAGPKMIARAGALRTYQSLSAGQRLATTPLYFVANARGNSYLQDDVQAGKPEQKIVVYFMSSEDANEYLEEMSQVNNANVNELRIMTVSMEKVLTQIQSKKQSRKLGRYEMDLIYRIQVLSPFVYFLLINILPYSTLMCNAAVFTTMRQCGTSRWHEKGLQDWKDVRIQTGWIIYSYVFCGRSCNQTRQRRGKIYFRSTQHQYILIVLVLSPVNQTVTPYYFAYEDLLEDWNKMLSSMGSDRKGIPREPKVSVRDFTEVMCLAQGISKESVEGRGNHL